MLVCGVVVGGMYVANILHAAAAVGGGDVVLVFVVVIVAVNRTLRVCTLQLTT